MTRIETMADINVEKPARPTRPLTRRGFLKMVGAGFLGLVAGGTAAGFNEGFRRAKSDGIWVGEAQKESGKALGPSVLSSNSTKEKPVQPVTTDLPPTTQDEKLYWASDIETAKNLPAEILDSKEFVHQVNVMRNILAAGGYTTEQVIAHPWTSGSPDDLKVRFVIQARDNGDLLFLEDKWGYPTRLEVPQEVKSLKWDFDINGVIGEDTSQNRVFKVEQLVLPDDLSLRQEKNFLDTNKEGIVVKAVLTGEIVKFEFYGDDKYQTNGEAYVARGFMRGSDGGIHGLNFLVSLTTPDGSELNLATENGWEKASAVMKRIKRGDLVEVGASLPGDRESCMMSNDSSICEILVPEQRDIASLAQNHIRNNDFPWWEILPTLSIRKVH